MLPEEYMLCALPDGAVNKKDGKSHHSERRKRDANLLVSEKKLVASGSVHNFAAICATAVLN
jgi:hypothetical protein